MTRGAGFDEPDAREILSIMAKPEYKEFFIDHMMIEELGKFVPDPDDSPAKAGLAMFLSFIFFGSVPMWTYVIFHLSGYKNQSGQFSVSCAMTAVALFFLGMVQVLPWHVASCSYCLTNLFSGVFCSGPIHWTESLVLCCDDDTARRAYSRRELSCGYVSSTVPAALPL